MTDYANFLLLGLGNGAVVAGIAVAIVLFHRSSGVINFATGALALHGAYTYAFLREGQLLNPFPPASATIDLGGEVPFVLAVALTLAIEAVIGTALWFGVFRPLRQASPVATVVASLAVAALLTGVIGQRVGANQVLVEPIFPTGTLSIGSVSVPTDRVWLAATMAVLAGVLAALHRYTRFGKATTAVADSELGAIVTGISPDRVAAANWALGTALAGMAGILISPLVPLVPGNYTLFVVPALAAAVLGRFSRLVPAVLGAYAIGMLQSEAVYLQSRFDWFPSSGVAEAVPLAAVLIVLVLRGQPLPTRGSPVQIRLGSVPRPRGLISPALAFGAVGAAALVLLEGSYRAALITSLIMTIVALSFVVITGYCGQVSLAQLTFAGAAAFALSPLTADWGVPFPLAPLFAAVLAAGLGVVVALPALRVRGLLLGVVTLTLAVALEAFWFRNPDLNGGSSGRPIEGPSPLGVDLSIGLGRGYPRVEFGLLCLVVLVGCALATARLRTGRLGTAMLAVRANEKSAAAAGIDVVRTKLAGFAVGAFLAGIAGTLLAYKQTNVTFEPFSAVGALSVLLVVYLAGVTSISGAVVAGLMAPSGIIFIAVDRNLEIGQWYSVIVALLLIVTVIANPEGIVGPLHGHLAHRRNHRIDETAPSRPTVEDDPTRSTATAGQLVLRGLSVHYGAVCAVDAVDLHAPAGRIVGLIGPNGAGKTTLMDAISGFVTATGTVELDGQRLHMLRPHERARAGLGRTFQSLDLYEDMTVRDNVEAGALGASVADIDSILAELDLLRIATTPVAQLSQGIRQLVSVARALAGRPSVLLLDEPAAGLDTAETEWLAGELRRVRDSGVTLLLVDHDMSLVLGLCDLIYVLDRGALLAAGTAAEILDDQAVAQAYLGSARTADDDGDTSLDQPAVVAAT